MVYGAFIDSRQSERRIEGRYLKETFYRADIPLAEDVRVEQEKIQTSDAIACAGKSLQSLTETGEKAAMEAVHLLEAYRLGITM